MRIVVSVNVSSKNIFLFVFVSSLSFNFNHCAVCFQIVHEHRLQELSQNAARIKRFLRLHIVVKPLNKKIKIINDLLC